MKTRLAGNSHAPSAARAYVTHQLTAGETPDGLPIDDVVLTASELVTNAVRAGAEWIDITLNITGRRLELLVQDDAGGVPVLATADLESVGGRGLHIVDRLADTWTVTPRATGKLVTATWLNRARDPRR